MEYIWSVGGTAIKCIWTAVVVADVIFATHIMRGKGSITTSKTWDWSKLGKGKEK